jgi:predicted dehydrogenase
MLNVGVIGVGYLGRHHARVYSGLEGVRLAAVSDTDEAALNEVSGKYGCRAYTDYKDMLKDVDALSIATPTSTHYEIALDCLREGKDILLEKPMTESVSEADSLIGEAEKKRLILQVGFLERYNPAVVRVAEFIDEPKFFESERLSPFIERAKDVDVTLDLMIHDIDIIISLLGGAEPKDIRVAGAKVLSGRFDVAKAWLEFEGASALVTASRLAGEKRRSLKVFQRNSYLSLDYQGREIKRYFREAGGISHETVTVEDKEPLKEELRDFVECIRTRRGPKVSGRDGRAALKVALDITKKIEDTL